MRGLVAWVPVLAFVGWLLLLVVVGACNGLFARCPHASRDAEGVCVACGARGRP